MIVFDRFFQFIVAIIKSSNDGSGAEDNTHKRSGCEDLLLWRHAAQLQEAGDSDSGTTDRSAHARAHHHAAKVESWHGAAVCRIWVRCVLRGSCELLRTVMIS